eukprot:5224070-Amphidinium_carterae.2
MLSVPDSTDPLRPQNTRKMKEGQRVHAPQRTNPLQPSEDKNDGGNKPRAPRSANEFKLHNPHRPQNIRKTEGTNPEPNNQSRTDSLRQHAQRESNEVQITKMHYRSQAKPNPAI